MIAARVCTFAVAALAVLLCGAQSAAADTWQIDGATAVFRSGDDPDRARFGYSPAASIPACAKEPCSAAQVPGLTASANHDPVGSGGCTTYLCPAAGVTATAAYLGGGDDTFQFDSFGWNRASLFGSVPWPVPAAIYAEGGNDSDANFDSLLRAAPVSYGGPAAVLIDGGEGDDRLTTLLGVSTTLMGGPGNDILIDLGGPGNVLSCGDGVDQVVAAKGAPLPAGYPLPKDCEQGLLPTRFAHVRVEPTGKLLATGIAVTRPGGAKEVLAPGADAVVPVGTIIDYAGQIKVTASTASGLSETIFTGTSFRVGQPAQLQDLVSAKLEGKPSCPQGAKRSDGRRRPRLVAIGSARISGPRGSGTSTDGTMLVELRCEGTYVKARKGTAEVRKASGKLVRSLSAGTQYTLK